MTEKIPTPRELVEQWLLRCENGRRQAQTTFEAGKFFGLECCAQMLAASLDAHKGEGK